MLNRRLSVYNILLMILIISYLVFSGTTSKLLFKKDRIEFERMTLGVTNDEGVFLADNRLEASNNKLSGNISIGNYSHKIYEFIIIFFVDYEQKVSTINNKSCMVHRVNISPNKEITLPFCMKIDTDNSDFLAVIIKNTNMEGPSREFFLGQRFIINGSNNIKNKNYAKVQYFQSSAKEEKYQDVFFLDENHNIMLNTKVDRGIVDVDLLITRKIPLTSVKLIALLDYKQIKVFDKNMQQTDILMPIDETNHATIPIKINIDDNKKHDLIIIVSHGPYSSHQYETLNCFNIDWSADCSNVLKINY